jgi:hypothetical protein
MAPNSSNVLNAVQVYRSLPILLSQELQIDCEITEKSAVTWTVLRFIDDPRMLATYPGLTVANLEKTAYHLNIPTNDLFLLPKDLPYGFYEIVARVEMKGLPDVFGSDSLYIQVVQTPWIEAAVVGGSFYTVPYGLMVSVGFRYARNCRLVKQEWAQPNFVGEMFIQPCECYLIVCSGIISFVNTKQFNIIYKQFNIIYLNFLKSSFQIPQVLKFFLFLK